MPSDTESYVIGRRQAWLSAVRNEGKREVSTQFESGILLMTSRAGDGIFAAMPDVAFGQAANDVARSDDLIRRADEVLIGARMLRQSFRKTLGSSVALAARNRRLTAELSARSELLTDAARNLLGQAVAGSDAPNPTPRREPEEQSPDQADAGRHLSF